MSKGLKVGMSGLHRTVIKKRTVTPSCLMVNEQYRSEGKEKEILKQVQDDDRTGLMSSLKANKFIGRDPETSSG